MIARLATIPFIIWLAYVLYQVYVNYDEEMRIWMVPPAIIIAVLFLSGKEIDRWIFRKKGRDLDEESAAWLLRFSPVYRQMPEGEREDFRKRVRRVIDHTQFIGMTGDKFPDDAGLALAQDQALLTRRKDWGIVDAYVLYGHPFLTPNRPEVVHSCEYEPEDKVVIVSAEQLLPGFLDPLRYLNISLYTQAQALMANALFRGRLGELSLPGEEELLALLGMEAGFVRSWLGSEELDVLGLAVCGYFYHGEKMAEGFPELYGRLSEMF